MKRRKSEGGDTNQHDTNRNEAKRQIQRPKPKRLSQINVAGWPNHCMTGNPNRIHVSLPCSGLGPGSGEVALQTTRLARPSAASRALLSPYYCIEHRIPARNTVSCTVHHVGQPGVASCEAGRFIRTSARTRGRRKLSSGSPRHSCLCRFSRR